MNKDELEKKKADFMQMLEDESPYDRETFQAQMKDAEGTWLETITMTANGNLQIKTWQRLPGGALAEGNSESTPGDGDYDDFLQEHGALKPGETHTLVRKMIDGEWVLETNKSDRAKSA